MSTPVVTRSITGTHSERVDTGSYVPLIYERSALMRGKQILITAAVSLAVVIGYQTYLAKKAS